MSRSTNATRNEDHHQPPKSHTRGHKSPSAQLCTNATKKTHTERKQSAEIDLHCRLPLSLSTKIWSHQHLMSTLQYRVNAAPSSTNSTSSINSIASSKSTTSRLSIRSSGSTASFKGGLNIPSGSSHSVNSSQSNWINSRVERNNSGTGVLPTIRRMASSFEQPQSLLAILQTQFVKVTSGFNSLSDSPPELWKAYLLKFLDSYAYFSFSLVFTLFLSEEFGMSDVQAGSIYGAWGALITVFGLFTGTVIDNLGVSKCLKIGFVLSFVTRTTLFVCTSRNVLLVCLLLLLPLANCLGEQSISFLLPSD